MVKADADTIHRRKKEIIAKMNEKRHRERVISNRGVKQSVQMNLAPGEKEAHNKKSNKIYRKPSVKLDKSLVLTKGGKKRPSAAEKESKNIAPKYETELRDGESMVSFMNRVNREKNKFIKESQKMVKHSSDRKKEWRKEVRTRKQDKKSEDEWHKLKDAEFDGKVELIPFGHVAERPPSFDDIHMPSEKKKASEASNSNLAILNRALAQANAEVRDKYRTNTVDEDGEISNKKMSKEERAKMVEDARRKMKHVEMEKARMQSILAYRDMKAKKGGSKTSLANLQKHGETLRGETNKAMMHLQSVDRGSMQ